MSGELGNETCRYIDVLVETSALSSPFHLDRERLFLYKFSVEKLVLLSFSRISRRDRVEGKKNLESPLYFFISIFVREQCCVRASASNLYKSY